MMNGQREWVGGGVVGGQASQVEWEGWFVLATSALSAQSLLSVSGRGH